MRRTIVNNPKDSLSRTVRMLFHYIAHQAIKRHDTGFHFATSEKFGTINVPSSNVSQRTAPFVFMFNFHAFAWHRRNSCMFSTSGLDTSLFVSTDNEFARFQVSSLPNSLIQIQYASSLLLKLWIPGKYPTTKMPWFNSILMKPTPDSRTTNFRYNSSTDSLHSNLTAAKARQWNLFFKWQFTGQRFDLDNHVRGKKRLDGRIVVYPLAHQDVLHRISFSTCLLFVGANSSVHRLFYFHILVPPSRQLLRERQQNTVPYICLLSAQALYAQLQIAGWYKDLFLAYVTPIVGDSICHIIQINFLFVKYFYVIVIMKLTT